MSFFQNPFDEYQGYWNLGDIKAFSLTFKVPTNKNFNGDAMIAWNGDPYDLSVNNTLTFNFAIDSDFKNWATFSVNVAGATPSATKAVEIRDILNATPAFSDWYTAYVDNVVKGGGPAGVGGVKNQSQRVYVRQNKMKTNFRTYITNSGAELVLKFNKYCGVADIPSYFDKDSITNRFNSSESQGRLVRLSHPITAISVGSPTYVTAPNHGLSTSNTVYIAATDSTPVLDGGPYTVTVLDSNTFTVPVSVTGAGIMGEFMQPFEYQIVTDAGLNYLNLNADWAHLRGRTDYFSFTKNTFDSNTPPRITQQLIYQAGAKAGGLAKKILYTYSGTNTTPTTTCEIPYVLQSSDLIVP
jgi:hypothetical protein